MQPAVARSLAGGQWRSLSERTGCSHGARNTAATFDVFFLLQVTNFCVSLLRSAPNGADHFDIDIFVLHTCASPAQRTPGLIITYGSGQDNLLRSADAAIRVYDAAGKGIETRAFRKLIASTAPK